MHWSTKVFAIGFASLLGVGYAITNLVSTSCIVMVYLQLFDGLKGSMVSISSVSNEVVVFLLQFGAP